LINILEKEDLKLVSYTAGSVKNTVDSIFQEWR